jgi:hypothetical protein
MQNVLAVKDVSEAFVAQSSIHIITVYTQNNGAG